MRLAFFTSLMATTVLAAVPAFTNLTPTTPPSIRRSPGAAVKAGAQETYFSYGGFAAGGMALAEIIYYRSATNTWTTMPTAPPRERHGLAYDPVHDVFVVAGGASGLTLFGTVLLINGTTFALSTPPSPATRPSARIDPLLQWIPAWGKFLYFGGRTSVLANNHVGDLWSLDVGDGGVTWAALPGLGAPSARGAVCSGYDPLTGKVIVFGGEASSNVADTWLYDTDGGTWASPVVTGTVPSARSFAACTWDPNLNQLVLYGGQTSTQVGGLFSFDPATNVWTAWPVMPNPGTLSDAAAAFSAARGGTIIFSGNSGGTTYTRETWLVTFNRPPVVDAGPNFSIGENVMTALSGSITDADGDVTTVSWQQTAGPMVTLTGPATLTPSFLTPRVLAPTQLSFVLTGRDPTSFSLDDDVNVTVLNSINEAPVADAGVDQTVDAGVVVTLSGSGVDPNGDAIAGFSWAQTGGAAVTLSSTMVASPSFTAPVAPMDSVLRFALTVQDGMALSAPDEVTVLVLAARVDAGTDAGVDAGADAGMDAGADAGSDAGPGDAGEVDAGSDAGSKDAGELDAGDGDAGTVDAGSLADAGLSDAGESPDAGDEDGGLSDGGRGAPQVLSVGCGCTEAPVSPGWLLLGLSWLAARRRRNSAD